MRAITILAAAAVIAGCEKAPDPQANNAAASAEAPPAQIVAGLYSQSTTLLELKDRSLSAAEATAAAKAIGTTQTAERCVTPEMVADPQKLVREDVDPQCRVERSRWNDGRIDFAMSCPENEELEGGSFRLAGTYGRESYSFELNASGAGDDVMRMRVDAKRLGDCAA
ncbi:MAG: DUF3617 family protein [Sphingomicrobium sp.]